MNVCPNLIEKEIFPMAVAAYLYNAVLSSVLGI
jgi:hypothetical protein